MLYREKGVKNHVVQHSAASAALHLPNIYKDPASLQVARKFGLVQRQRHELLHRFAACKARRGANLVRGYSYTHISGYTLKNTSKGFIEHPLQSVRPDPTLVYNVYIYMFLFLDRYIP